jgi:alkylation response protein AidB-like acyl-CoA dehydrogenase
MNFDLSEDQCAFQQSARSFAAIEMAPYAANWDAECIFPIDVIQKAGELGFCGMYTPESEGGMGLTRLDASIVFEELAYACPSTAAYITIHNMACWMVATWGTERVRAQWSPLLASGQKLASYCLTEPNAGSDAASLTTRAELIDGHYRINGAKAFISGAGSTDLLVVMARTGGEGAGGISAFAIPADAAGIHYGRKEQKMGWNSQPTRTISFDQVLIPADHLLGEEGEGFKIAMRGIDGGRINIATCSMGAAQAALDAARIYMAERQQFKRKLADFQALQFKLADMVSVYCAMAKRFATDIGFQVCNDALQLHGGNGYIREYPLERYLRDVRVHQILEGTNEIMRVIISRQMLNGIAPQEIR